MTFKEMWSLVKMHIPSSLNSLKSEKKESTSLSSTPNFWKSIALFEDSQALRAGSSDRNR